MQAQFFCLKGPKESLIFNNYISLIFAIILITLPLWHFSARFILLCGGHCFPA